MPADASLEGLKQDDRVIHGSSSTKIPKMSMEKMKLYEIANILQLGSAVDRPSIECEWRIGYNHGCSAYFCNFFGVTQQPIRWPYDCHQLHTVYKTQIRTCGRVDVHRWFRTDASRHRFPFGFCVEPFFCFWLFSGIGDTQHCVRRQL